MQIIKNKGGVRRGFILIVIVSVFLVVGALYTAVGYISLLNRIEGREDQLRVAYDLIGYRDALLVQDYEDAFNRLRSINKKYKKSLPDGYHFGLNLIFWLSVGMSQDIKDDRSLPPYKAEHYPHLLALTYADNHPGMI